MRILNCLEGEMITFCVALNDQFSAKVRSEDGNLQEIVQITPLPNGHHQSDLINGRLGYWKAIGDETYAFFAKGNLWTYQQLVKSLGSLSLLPTPCA